MSILCLNAGSSSLKFALYDEKLVTQGAFENLTDHHQAVGDLLKQIESGQLSKPTAVGHRIVQGGPDHEQPSRVDAQLVARLRELIPLAPLHLPSQVTIIEAVSHHFPELPQVACFDTAFHRHLPPRSRYFALPRSLREKGIHRYGFHGLSYESILFQLGDKLPPRIVIAHLGNGASLAAVHEGKCIDTTMGLTPTGGVMMGTRSGDLDPGILIYLMRTLGYDADRLEKLLNDESGLLGVSGTTSDMKELLEHNASEAVEMFCYQVRKQIGALTAALGGIDLLVFTGGIGERSAIVRNKILEGLDAFGIGTPNCPVRVMEAEEDLMIARHTNAVVSQIPCYDGL